MPAKKKTAARKAVKKTAKKTVKKAVKKAVAKKATAKKAPAKKVPLKKVTSSKATANKATVKKARSKKATTKIAGAAEAKAEAPVRELEKDTKEIVLGARKRTSTPSVFKTKKPKNTPIMFTMEDVAGILEQRKNKVDAEETTQTEEVSKKSKRVVEDAPTEHRNHAAASLADILGFNPNEAKNPRGADSVPRKWSKYYKTLIELREHVSDGLALHTADTLKRSNKDDSGDLSGYGQHMADAGTDSFDRDFALSLVSNEQEALYEIEEAIQRIFDGKYGICEITGESIDKDRLLAVPFTRFSLEGQRELERNRRRKEQRGGVFADNDDSLSLGGDDDGDDS